MSEKQQREAMVEGMQVCLHRQRARDLHGVPDAIPKTDLEYPVALSKAKELCAPPTVPAMPIMKAMRGKIPPRRTPLVHVGKKLDLQAQGLPDSIEAFKQLYYPSECRTGAKSDAEYNALPMIANGTLSDEETLCPSDEDLVVEDE